MNFKIKKYNFSYTASFSSKIFYPKNLEELKILLTKNFTIIGNLRSYGDTCIGSGKYLSLSRFNKILSLDKKNKIIEIESGVSLKQMNDFIFEKGFILSCMPGCKYVSIGGMISNNISGKLLFKNKIKNYVISLKIINNKNKFFQFKDGWISKNDLKPIRYIERDFFKKVSIFKNVIYKWGGKSFKGIDCSALVQICLNFNNKFCPRDAKDQVRYFKKNINIKKLKKNDIIYWKGHVAVIISKKKLIHAYGPRKKTVIMDISKTIKLINKTANLKVLSCKRIKL